MTTLQNAHGKGERILIIHRYTYPDSGDAVPTLTFEYYQDGIFKGQKSILEPFTNELIEKAKQEIRDYFNNKVSC